MGPVDVYIIAFPENQFSGEIVPAIQQQVNAGVIRILDVLFVVKDGEGNVATLTAQDIGPAGAAFAEIEVAQAGSLNDEDADEVGDDLPLNSSALLIAYENTWMSDLVGAFDRAGAVVIDQIRIPAYVVNEVVAS